MVVYNAGNFPLCIKICTLEKRSRVKKKRGEKGATLPYNGAIHCCQYVKLVKYQQYC